MTKAIKLFGVPGSGKTTTCMNMIQYLLGFDNSIGKKFLEGSKTNYSIMDICFCSFTKASIRSIKEKLELEAGIVVPKDSYIRTIHSLTFKVLGFNPKDILSETEIKSFFNNNNYKTYSNILGVPPEHSQVIDLYDKLVNYYSTRFINIPINDINDFVIKNRFTEEREGILSSDILIRGMIIYDKWKTMFSKKSFSDVLIDVYEQKIDIPCKVLIVDEAQDLSRLQANIIDLWTKNYSREVFVIAGDDDQTVHEWTGANPDFLIEFEIQGIETHKLEYSYRLPRNVASFVDVLIHNVNYRQEKHVFSHNPDGEISYLTNTDYDKICRYLRMRNILGEKTFLLFRTNKMRDCMANELFSCMNIPFCYVSDRNNDVSHWNSKFLAVCNALNKLNSKDFFTKYEVLKLFDCLPSSTCLVHGVKTKVKSSTVQEYSWDEVVNMTKLWKPQTTIDIFSRVGVTSTLKDRVLEYVDFFGSSTSLENINLNDLYKRKCSSFTTIVPLLFDGKDFVPDFKVHLGTFHASKGLECVNCVVFLGSSYVFRDVNDSEVRCLYTATSRCSKRLIFVGTMLDDRQSPVLEQSFGNLILSHCTGVVS